MESKDYTDYLITIWGWDERAFRDMHIKFVKPKRKGGNNSKVVSCYPVQDELVVSRDTSIPSLKYDLFKYEFDSVMNWAFKTKFSPWKKLDFRHPYGSLIELTRTKRIGHLHYREPCNHICKKCSKFETLYPDCHPALIKPIHFSRIRQPSGRDVDEPVEMVQDPNYPGDLTKKVVSRVELVTPKMLKDRIENRFYQAQYGSYKFGAMKKLGSKWLLLVIGGVVAFVFILYFTGNLPGV